MLTRCTKTYSSSSSVV